MRAVAFEEHGGPDVLKTVELPQPEPGRGEVLLRVEAVAMNHLDLWVRQGLPGPPLPMPHLLGSEIVGVVEALGEGAEEDATGAAAAESAADDSGGPALPGLYGDPIGWGSASCSRR